MDRYKARQAGLNAMKAVGRTLIEGISSTVTGLRYVHRQKSYSSPQRYSHNTSVKKSFPKQPKAFKMPKMKSPVIKDFNMPNLPSDVRKKLNQEAIASGKEPRW